MTVPELAGACPQCGATQLKAVALPRTSVEESLAKEFFAAGGQSSSRDMVTQGLCSRCGCRWIPRTSQERRLRALSGQLGQDAQRAAQAEEAKRRPRRAASAGGLPWRKPGPLVWLLVAGILVELVLVLLT